MRTLFSLFLSLSVYTSYSQDSLKIKQVDSMVSVIVHGNFPTRIDSSFQDYSAIGLTMKTYNTTVTYGKDLKKYINYVKAKQIEQGKSKETSSGSAFYYDQNKLIKVEEFLVQEGKDFHMDWYFENEKCFHYTSTPDKADRISLLLAISKDIVKQNVKQN